MDTMNYSRSAPKASESGLEHIWRQPRVPVVYRPPEGDLHVKLPYGEDNRKWLHEGRRSKPAWVPQYKCWLLPRSCFSELAERLLQRFGQAYVIQPHDAKEVCAPACWSARGLECECSCLGVNHGKSAADTGQWYIISETCAVRWRGRELRWSLLRRKPNEARP